MRAVYLSGLTAALTMFLGLAASTASAGTLTGEVTYRERIALPPGASLRVKLVDMTAAGTPVRVEAAATIGSPGQVPLTFTLNFDDRAITAGNNHALVAEISAGVELWFRNSTPYDIDPLAPATPIAIVTDFVGRRAQTDLPAATDVAADPSSIIDVTWEVVSIRGEPTAEDVASTLAITPDLRAGGRGGCNSYFAQASLAGTSLSFSAAGSTKMACLSPEATAQETAYFSALQQVRSYRTEDGQLVLLNDGEVEVLRFARSAR